MRMKYAQCYFNIMIATTQTCVTIHTCRAHYVHHPAIVQFNMLLYVPGKFSA
jgi:hypothetical protein